MTQQMHINLFIHSRGHHEASWRHPDASPLSLTDVRYYVEMAQKAEAGLFDSLVSHPRVLRVVALSGGYKRAEACAELAKNRGMIASFSRALLEDLRHQMTDAEFDASLAAAIDEIYTGSTQKTLVAA